MNRAISQNNADALEPRLWAVVPCAGTGSRAGGDGPKQYQLVAGVPMVEHTLNALAQVARLAGVLVVTAPDDDCRPGSGIANVQVQACGGATRAATVVNGLAHLLAHGAHNDDWVLVHDAARCVVTARQINTLIDTCLPDAVGGLLAVPMVDTLKEQEAGDAHNPRVSATHSRVGKWLAQTPQMFRLGALAQALQVTGDRVSDESSAMEAMGWQPLLIASSTQNLKVTYPEDFILAEAILNARAAPV